MPDCDDDDSDAGWSGGCDADGCAADEPPDWNADDAGCTDDDDDG
jgi:hypothetical protein